MFSPLAPIAPAVIEGIELAEQMAGKSGREKLALVQQMARKAAEATNAQMGRTVIDPNEMDAASSGVISGVVSIVNIAHGSIAG